MAKKDKKNLGIKEDSKEPGGTIAKIVNKLQGKKKPEKKGRGHYKQKECPYCHNHYGNLANHIKLKHPLEVPPVELTKEALTEKQPPKPASPEDTVYYCDACRAVLRKGENPCWHCGNTLVWEGVE